MTSDSKLTLDFIKHQQQSMHLDALYMPRNLPLDMASYRPCSASIVSADGVRESKQLSYDDAGRLVKQETRSFVRSGSLAGMPRNTTRVLQVTYDDRHLIQSVIDGDFVTTYTYDASGAIERTQGKPPKPSVVTPARSSVFTLDDATRTISSRTMAGNVPESGASSERYVFDQKGRLISADGLRVVSGKWAYTTSPDQTQQVEHVQGSVTITHTLKDGRVIRSVKKDPANGVVLTETLYSYTDGKLTQVTVTDKPANKIQTTLTYKHTCS